MTRDVDDLAGRIIVVTGAGSGIGRASAARLSSSAALVYCCDIRGSEEAAAQVSAGGGRAIAVHLDVTDKAAVNDLFASIVAEHGRIDGLVASAGVISNGAIETLDEAELDRILDINLKGTLWCCQAAAKHMRAARSGSIVTFSSTAADHGIPDTGAYAMSKAAVVQLTRVLALELATSGVRVNGIAPGVVVTGITERHFRGEDGSVDPARREAVIERLSAIAPMKRVGTVDEIAGAVHFLIGADSSFVTGQILRVNGGAFLA